MTSAKPTMGYPTRRAAVGALVQEGKDAREIACVLDMSLNTARQHIHQYKKLRSGRTRIQIIDRKLRPHADKRGIDVDTLKEKILEAVTYDGIVNAVLDDGVE